jgi:hypothetical protein
MTVQRFGTSSAPCPNGVYVRHSDYAALEAECERLRADKARLDWLDQQNAALNRHYGTTYQWKVILSQNITRLMTGRQWGGYCGDIDLNDANSGTNAVASCREAIDEARNTK